MCGGGVEGTADALTSFAMLMPTISRYMTRQPWTVAKDAGVSEAQRIMREHGVRHLPVVDSDRLVGVVSARDLHLLETLRAVEPDELTVGDAMVGDVYTVCPDASVDEVVEHMADRKLGSTVIVDREGRVNGIFTTVDALQFFADLLRRVTA